MSHAHLVFLRANQGHCLAMKKLAAVAPQAMESMQKLSSGDQKFNPDSELVLHEFVAAVVRLADARLKDRGPGDLPNRIERIMHNFIIPNCGRAIDTTNTWYRTQMAKEPLNSLYVRNEKALRFVFEGYASLDERDTRKADFNVTEFLRLIHDAKLLDSKAKPTGMAVGGIRRESSVRKFSVEPDVGAALSAAKLRQRSEKEGVSAGKVGLKTTAKVVVALIKSDAPGGSPSAGLDLEVKDGLTLHEVIEIFVRSQIEATGEGMVQMDYEVRRVARWTKTIPQLGGGGLTTALSDCTSHCTCRLTKFRV